MRYLKEIFHKFQQSSGRTSKTYKNVALSLCARSVSILVPLLIVPLTINYVNPVRYGIWLTLSSIISMISIFDLGLGNGFRNKFAIAVANRDTFLAKKYVSTTYLTITILVSIIFIVFLLANTFIDWTDVLNVSSEYADELTKVMIIISGFFCLNMVVNIFGTLLTANQQIGVWNIVIGIGQVASLIVIYVLTKISTGSLLNLALYFSGIPCLITFITSIIAFRFTKLSIYSPSWKFVDFKLVKDILGLGIKFFVIQICLVLFTQLTNIVISRELGPESVTQYNIVHRYFGLITTATMILISPFWSAFTDAFACKDYFWMKSTIKRLTCFWVISIAASLFMLLISPIIYKIWIGDSVLIPFGLSCSMFVYSIVSVISTIYMYTINGIGKVMVQLIIYVIFTILAWPLLVFSCRTFGVCGVALLPSVTLLFQAFLGKVQISKLLNETAFGIWGK